ncbi:2443_t:CDS:2 [Entrophospora sp. SA101]|nr:2443_t:CDS:2 [Entrophospora sp. SA101]
MNESLIINAGITLSDVHCKYSLLIFDRMRSINEISKLEAVVNEIDFGYEVGEIYSEINPLPGPFPFPLVGNLIGFYRNNGRIQKYLIELHHRYGATFELYIGGVRRIVFCDVENVDKLCTAAKNNAFLIRLPYTEGFDELGIAGKGLIMNYNVKSWRYNRQFFTQAILSPGFDNKSLDWANKLLKEMEQYWQLLKNENGDKVAINLDAWVHRFTHDIITVVTTGERAYSMAYYLNTLSDKHLDYPSALLEDSERFIKGVRTHFLGGPIFIAVPSIIRHYLPMTANLFCVIAYFLAKNPLVKKKMVEEIDSIFGDDKTREITHDDLNKLKYCDAIIKEVDRLVPIVNTVARYSTRKEEIGGYEWPADENAGVPINSFAITMSREILVYVVARE